MLCVSGMLNVSGVLGIFGYSRQFWDPDILALVPLMVSYVGVLKRFMVIL